MKAFLLILAMASAAGIGMVKLSKSISAGPLQISPQGKDLIVEFETGGQADYERHLKSPDWPGGASGVTIGIGYDCGYNTRAQILSDWSALPAGPREALAGAAGIKGANAKVRTQALKWIVVPWETAEGVFVAKTMPRFGKLTEQAFPGVTKDHGHVQGAMLSLVFNRGSSLSGDSRREMRSIRDDIAAGKVKDIPIELRRMTRVWEGTSLFSGLRRRRYAEAALVELSFE